MLNTNKLISNMPFYIFIEFIYKLVSNNFQPNEKVFSPTPPLRNMFIINIFLVFISDNPKGFNTNMQNKIKHEISVLHYRRIADTRKMLRHKCRKAVFKHTTHNVTAHHHPAVSFNMYGHI